MRCFSMKWYQNTEYVELSVWLRISYRGVPTEAILLVPTEPAVVPGLAYLCVGVLTPQAWVGPMLAEDSRPITSAREPLFLLPCEPYRLNIITYGT